MTSAVVLHVSGTPRPKQSARWVNGRPVSVAKTQKHLKAWTQRIVTACRAHLRAGGQPLSGAIAIRTDCFFASKDSKRHGQPHTNVPDKDNLEKAILDALQRGGILANDSAVAGGPLWKWWAAKAGAVIELRPFNSQAVERASVARDSDDDLGAKELS